MIFFCHFFQFFFQIFFDFFKISIKIIIEISKSQWACLSTIVVRIIDTNDGENAFEDRKQALKLIRKLLTVAPESLPGSFITSLIAIIKCSARPVEKGDKRQETVF